MIVSPFMRRIGARGILVGIALAALVSPSETQEHDALSQLNALLKVTSALEHGMNALLTGRHPVDAFDPIDVAVSRRFAEQLAEHGVDSIRMIGMEFEIVYYRGDHAVYYLRTFVHPTRDGVTFISFAGRAPERGRVSVRNHPFDRFWDTAAPLGIAAEGPVTIIRDGPCSVLSAPRAEELSRLVSPHDRAEVVGQVARVKRGIQRECDVLARVSSDRAHLRIDDVSFAALGSDGMATGTIRSTLELVDGNLRLEIAGMR